MVDPNPADPAVYAPTYYDETVGLPAPEGVYVKEVHSTKNGAAQVNEAST
jgi:hypothetical protein